MKEKKERIDNLLVMQGLAKSRTQAQALIMAGSVCKGDQLILKPSEMFETSAVFRVKPGALSEFVSRGGVKLKGALETVKLDVTGFRALDVGISTGGFTDCLLQRGVVEITGVDVGHNQLDWKLRKDPRVRLFEGVNARELPPEVLTQRFDLAVVDVSFISLTLVLSEVKKTLKTGGYLLALIKPQFEVEKGQVGKGGIVKDPLLHTRVQEKIKAFCEQLGFADIFLMASPIEGSDGNKEFFIFGRSF